MNFIQKARESVATYSIVGNEPMIELQQILAVIIGANAKQEICGRLAQFGVKGLVDLSIQELENVGLSHFQALKLHSVVLLANKLKNVKEDKKFVVRSPQSVADYLMDDMKDLKQEHFIVLYLDTKNQLIHKQTLFVGTLDETIAHPREVFREAVRYSSSSIIVAHNHPSGDPTASQSDIHVTKRLKESGEIVGCELLDHIIIGQNKFTSLKEKGYI